MLSFKENNKAPTFQPNELIMSNRVKSANQVHIFTNRFHINTLFSNCSLDILKDEPLVTWKHLKSYFLTSKNMH